MPLYEVKSLCGGKAGYVVVDSDGVAHGPKYDSRTIAESVAQRWNREYDQWSESIHNEQEVA